VLTPLLKYEWGRGVTRDSTSLLTEYAVALRWLAERYPPTLLDVGPGPSSWPHLVARTGIAVTAIDNMESPWRGRFLNRQRFFNRHYYVIRDDVTSPTLQERFDCVTCLSLLGLVPDHRAAVRGMFSLLEPGGILILSCPYNEHRFIDNAYALPGADTAYATAGAICRQYSRAELDAWLAENGGRLVERELYRCFTGDFWSIGERVAPAVQAGPDDLHHLACMCIEKT
jgi:SAM-dependent methyltransferase